MKRLEHFVKGLEYYPIWKAAKEHIGRGKLNERFYKSAMKILAEAVLIKKRKKVKNRRKKKRKRKNPSRSKDKGKLVLMKKEDNLLLHFRENNKFNFRLTQNFLLAIVMKSYEYIDIIKSR